MGWYFRRSKKFGPFRITVSKSGISTSVGVGGLRLTNSSHGTHFSASPGGGLYYRQRIGGQPLTPALHPPGLAGSGTPDDATKISSEPVVGMIDHAAILERINNNEARARWLPWIGYCLCALLLFTLQGLGLLVGVVIVALCYVIRNYLRSRSPAQLNYDLDDEDRRKYEGLRGALDALARCQRLWQVNAFRDTNDWKRNAGANQLINRSPASVASGCARSFVANVDVFHLQVKGEILYFLPDMLLIRQKGRFGSVSYSNLESASSAVNFREEQDVPSDAQVVSTTWRFVNKSGGPDRRFNNNRQIPVAKYGEIALRSNSGLRLALMTSSAQAADAFVAGIRFVQSFKPAEMVYLPSPAE